MKKQPLVQTSKGSGEHLLYIISDLFVESGRG